MYFLVIFTFQISAIVVVAEFSGLLDHTIGNINTLYKAAKITEKPVIIFASDCLAFLLQPVSMYVTTISLYVFYFNNSILRLLACS